MVPVWHLYIINWKYKIIPFRFHMLRTAEWLLCDSTQSRVNRNVQISKEQLSTIIFWGLFPNYMKQRHKKGVEVPEKGVVKWIYNDEHPELNLGFLSMYSWYRKTWETIRTTISVLLSWVLKNMLERLLLAKHCKEGINENWVLENPWDC